MKKNNSVLCLLLLCLLLCACGEPEIVVVGEGTPSLPASEQEKDAVPETDSISEAEEVRETKPEMLPPEYLMLQACFPFRQLTPFPDQQQTMPGFSPRLQ